MPNIYLPLVLLLGFYCFAAPRATFGDWFWAVLVTHWFCAGLGFVISLVFSQQRAQMVAVIIGALLNVVSGFFPRIPELESMLGAGAHVVLAPSYARWLMEGLFALEAERLPQIFSFRVVRITKRLSYCVDSTPSCEGVFGNRMLIIFLMGLGLRVLALLLLLFRHRGQQNRKPLWAHVASFFLSRNGGGADDGRAAHDPASSERYGVDKGGASKRKQSAAALADDAAVDTDDDDNDDAARQRSESTYRRLERTKSDLGKPQRDKQQRETKLMEAPAIANASLDEWVAQAQKVASGESPNNPTERWAQALFDCNAERDDELSFARGDMMTVIDSTDPNWWQCALNTGGGESIVPVTLYHATNN